MKSRTLRLGDELDSAIIKLAAERKESVNALISKAIEEYVLNTANADGAALQKIRNIVNDPFQSAPKNDTE